MRNMLAIHNFRFFKFQKRKKKHLLFCCLSNKIKFSPFSMHCYFVLRSEGCNI